jgi:hypothetical protein
MKPYQTSFEHYFHPINLHRKHTGIALPIKAEQFELYEVIILSGQMAQEDVPSFLERNVEFSDWYKKRMSERHGQTRKPPPIRRRA